MNQDWLENHLIVDAVGDEEAVEVRARAGEVAMVVTDQRLLVASRDRKLLDIPIEGLRRIQFDIERERPATLVLVPEHPAHEPQVLAVPPEDYDEVADALVAIGRQLANLKDRPG